MVAVTCLVSSLSGGTAFKKSGQEIGTSMTSLMKVARNICYQFLRPSRFCTKSVVFSDLEHSASFCEGRWKLLLFWLVNWNWFEIPANFAITNAKKSKINHEIITKETRFLCRKFGAVPGPWLDTWEVGIVTGPLEGSHIKVRLTQNACLVSFRIDST